LFRRYHSTQFVLMYNFVGRMDSVCPLCSKYHTQRHAHELSVAVVRTMFNFGGR
jgi:hypothetical protein